MCRAGDWKVGDWHSSSPPKFGGSSGTTEGGAAVDSRLFSSIASNFPLPQLTAPPADRLRDTVVLVPVQSPRFSKELAYPCLYCCLYSSNFLPLPLFAPLNPSFREFYRNDVGRKTPCSTSLWVNEPGRRETQEVRR